jgi:hypothetical protein
VRNAQKADKPRLERTCSNSHFQLHPSLRDAHLKSFTGLHETGLSMCLAVNRCESSRVKARSPWWLSQTLRASGLLLEDLPLGVGTGRKPSSCQQTRGAVNLSEQPMRIITTIYWAVLKQPDKQKALYDVLIYLDGRSNRKFPSLLAAPTRLHPASSHSSGRCAPRQIECGPPDVHSRE